MTLHEVNLEENATKTQKNAPSFKKCLCQQKFLSRSRKTEYLEQSNITFIAFPNYQGRGNNFVDGWSVDISFIMHI